MLVIGTNYHDQDRSDTEARYLVENALAWAANPRPLAWFKPASTSAVASPGSTVNHALRLVNRTNVTTAFNLSVTGNSWSTSLVDTLGNPLTSVGPLAPNAGADVVVKVQIPGAATTSATDTVTVHAAPVNPAGQAASAQVATSAPGPAYRVRVTANAFQVLPSVPRPSRPRDRPGWRPGGERHPGGLHGHRTRLGIARRRQHQWRQGHNDLLRRFDMRPGRVPCASGRRLVRTDISVATSGPVEFAPGAHIAANTTWTACAGPYIVHGAMTVDPGATLTVMAGTQARFDFDAALIVLGTLNVSGRKERPGGVRSQR